MPVLTKCDLEVLNNGLDGPPEVRKVNGSATPEHSCDDTCKPWFRTEHSLYISKCEKKMARSEVQRCMDWLCQQQGEMESANFGYGQTSVLEALALQQSKVKDINNFWGTIQKTVDNENVDDKSYKELTGNYNSVKALSQKRSSCLEVVSQIASLEDLVQNLSGEIDLRAVHLVNASGEKGEEDTKGDAVTSNESMARTAQSCITSVRKNWRWVFQVMQCAEVHLRNAAAYQEYNHEVEEAEYWMNTTLSRIHLSFDRSKLNGNKSDADAMLGEIRDVLAAYLQWQTKIDYLYDRAKDVVPITHRTEAMKEESPVIALTDFSSSEISFIDGEALTLVDNSDRKKWKVRNTQGQVGYVPAVIILIPSPCGNAMDAAVRLRLQLLALWTSSVKRLGYQMIAFMLLVLRDWTEEEVHLLQSMNPADKEELLRILHLIESSLSKDWNGYGDFQELQERITRLKMILEEHHESNGIGNGDEQFSQSVVVQLQSLEDLMKKYTDFWTFWETFKSIAEMLKNPKFMLVCDKWEQLRFVTSAHFVRFWDTQLDLAKEDITKSQASLVMHETPRDTEMFSSEITIDEELEETTTDTVTTSLEEEQHTFIITGVLDPRDEKTKLNLQDAIMLGILDQANNTYNNPVTGTSMPMPEAMNEGRIIMEFVSRKKIREEQKSYGLITIKVTKETRPYTIKDVVDPRTDERISVSEAVKRKILDSASTIYKDKDDQSMPMIDAIHSGLVHVEYHEIEGMPHAKPDSVTKTYAVHGVVDQKKKSKVSFADAVKDGLLDKETGQYINNATGAKVGVQEAIMKGFIKARVITDPSKLEVNPENTIVVEKLASARNKIMRAVKVANAFKKGH